MRRGGEAMDFPRWMQRAIQARLNEVTARIEHDPELSRVRGEQTKRLKFCLQVRMSSRHLNISSGRIVILSAKA